MSTWNALLFQARYKSSVISLFPNASLGSPSERCHRGKAPLNNASNQERPLLRGLRRVAIPFGLQGSTWCIHAAVGTMGIEHWWHGLLEPCLRTQLLHHQMALDVSAWALQKTV